MNYIIDKVSQLIIKKNPIDISKFICLTIFISVKLVYNFKKIKKANRIFVNSWGFGHSITDTSAYLNHYRENGIVISLGTSFGQIPGTERNNLFFLLRYHERIIQLNMPTVFLSKDNWISLHPLTLVLLRIIASLLGNSKLIVEGNNEKINIDILPRVISQNLKINLIDGKGILTDLLLRYKSSENHYQSPHTIQFFFKQPKINTRVLKSQLNSSLKLYYKKNLGNNKFVCLTIRRGNAPYHSSANYYKKVIDLLHVKGFKVYLLGDKQYLTNFTNQEIFSYSKIIINYQINKKDSKLLDLLAIADCEFVIGDQGGVWSLVHAFNKPGLIINSSCVAHLQYNVESLPRKWIYDADKSEVTEANILFGELFFRYKPFYIEKRKLKVIQAENDLNFILRVVERYTNKSEYLNQRKMQKKLSNFFPSNNQLKLANASSYSNEYLAKLDF
jgi:putative glycosyltransferase (TIGR04372 family)